MIASLRARRRLDFLEMFHVAANTLAAGMEGCLLTFCQRQLDDLLDAVFTDDAGNACKKPFLAVLAAQLRACRKNDLLIVQHGVGHARGGRGNAVFGAEFAGKGDPAAADGLLLQRLPIKAEALVRLGPCIERHAAEADAGPGGKLLVAVLAQHVTGDGLVVKTGLARERAQKARGVEARAGAEHTAAGESQMQRQLARDDVAGVGDVDEHTVKTAGLDLFGVTAHGGDREVHLGQAVMRAAQQVDLANAVDDDIADAEVGETAAAHRDAMGHIGDRVAQILHLACKFLFILVDEHQLVCDALNRQRVSHVCANMPHADHTENSFLCHKNTSFLKNGMIVVGIPEGDCLLCSEMGEEHAGIEHGKRHVQNKNNGEGLEGLFHDFAFIAHLIDRCAGGDGVVRADEVAERSARILTGKDRDRVHAERGRRVNVHLGKHDVGAEARAGDERAA